ncbi:hypothetical protein PAHAL_1G176900 [Panicum hallii]|uniref:Uncharacterized protein n=1 Tax=Panicum hallii TaxID=206008 RepID=A0A2T8KVN9_9POAL|nr:hypothetical protein PAHAL_1G176900 [Panicum hallii]
MPKLQFYPRPSKELHRFALVSLLSYRKTAGLAPQLACSRPLPAAAGPEARPRCFSPQPAMRRGQPAGADAPRRGRPGARAASPAPPLPAAAGPEARPRRFSPQPAQRRRSPARPVRRPGGRHGPAAPLRGRPRERASAAGEGRRRPRRRRRQVGVRGRGGHCGLHGAGPRGENKTLHIRLPANTLSHNELLALWEGKTGRRASWCTSPRTPSSSRSKRLRFR